MTEQTTETNENLPVMDLPAVSKLTGISLPDLHRVCASNYITSFPLSGRIVIMNDDLEKLQKIAESPRLLTAAITLGKSFMYEYHPELLDYLYFHDTLDVLCWLLKIRYSERDTIRRRNYRLDKLLIDFLAGASIDIKKLSRIRGERHSPELMSFHLTKGWYNELVRSNPITENILRIGPRISRDSPSCDSAAWNIIQSYYAVYEFINTLVFTNTDNLRTDEHRRSTNHFNSTLLKKMARHIVRYPFSLTSSGANNELNKINRKIWQYQYARWPREEIKDIFDLHDAYINLLGDSGNFIDFMYSFRVWANYLGINVIIGLEEGYYLKHLYQNLATVCFFYGCFAELSCIAILGENHISELLENVAERYILRREQYREQWYYIPLFVRFRIYQRFGIISKELDFLTPPTEDPLTEIVV